MAEAVALVVVKAAAPPTISDWAPAPSLFASMSIMPLPALMMPLNAAPPSALIETVPLAVLPLPEVVALLKVTEATAITTDVAGYETNWKLDGKKHQVAQMEGGVVEFLGEWHGKTLFLEKSIPGAGGVRREFKSLGENELEVKLTVNVGKKMEQKLVYTRVP